MKINRNNYEAFFLDYIEGTLGTTEKAELEAFLVNNPDLKTELDNFESISLPFSENIFSQKELLKKDITNILKITDSNFEELCIARLEGDMDKDTEVLFERYLNQNPDQLRTYKLYLKTILEPDKTIVYKEKQKLKHLKIGQYRTPIYISIAAAASIAIMLSVYIMQYNDVQKPKIASMPKTNLPAKIEINSLSPVKIYKVAKVEHKDNLIQKSIIIEPTKLKTESLTRAALPDLQPQQAIDAKTVHASIELVSPALAGFTLAGTNILRKSTIANKEKYLTLNEYAKEEVKKIVESQIMTDNRGIDFWGTANKALAQLNKYTGANIEMKKIQDTTNNRTRIEFSSGLLGYYTSKNE
jgi:hypothetical protein